LICKSIDMVSALSEVASTKDTESGFLSDVGF